MPFAFCSLPGLDRDRVLAAVEPVLAVHGVAGVELVWRTDRGRPVLGVTIEKPGAEEPGLGVTIGLCSEVSRDLAVALDAAGVIGSFYHLEVGSPGIERRLYSADDYRRFSGRTVRIRLTKPLEGQRVVTGVLRGRKEHGILVETDQGQLELDPAQVEQAQLVFAWKRPTGRTTSGVQGRNQKRSESRARRTPPGNR